MYEWFRTKGERVMVSRFQHVLVPGTFDPITLGHIDVVIRATRLAPKVTVCVAQSLNKNNSGTIFTLEERVDLVREALKPYVDVDVIPFSGLLVDVAQQLGAQAVVKGLRATTDFEYELQQAALNHQLYGELESLFVMSNPKLGYLSSSAVRQISSMGGDVSQFVTPNVLEALKKKFMQ